MTAGSGTDAVTYAEVLAANVRAARARAGIDQRTLGQRMATLGYGAWAHYQTVSKVENGRRPLSAAEILGLALALDASVSTLVAAAEGDLPVALASDVLIGPATVRALACGVAGRVITWDGGRIAAPPADRRY